MENIQRIEGGKLHGISIKHHYQDEFEEDKQFFKSNTSSEMSVLPSCTPGEEYALGHCLVYIPYNSSLFIFFIIFISKQAQCIIFPSIQPGKTPLSHDTSDYRNCSSFSDSS